MINERIRMINAKTEQHTIALLLMEWLRALIEELVASILDDVFVCDVCSSFCRTRICPSRESIFCFEVSRFLRKIVISSLLEEISFCNCLCIIEACLSVLLVDCWTQFAAMSEQGIKISNHAMMYFLKQISNIVFCQCDMAPLSGSC